MIRIFSYSQTTSRMETPSIAELPQHLSDKDRTIWVDLEAPDDEEMGVLGGIFGFHVLAAEDCINGRYLPKIDFYDSYIFAVLHAVDLPELEQGFQAIEVGFFMGERFLVTHHVKQVKGIFDARGQVAKNPGSLLKSTDWLFHHIADAMVDHFSTALASFDARISAFTQTHQGDDVVGTLNRELAHLCRLGRLQQEVLTHFSQKNVPGILEGHRLYFANVHAHMVRVVQTTEFLQDRLDAAVLARGVYERTQQTQASQRLTVIGALFAPLILLAVLFDVDLSEGFGGGKNVGQMVGLGLVVALGGSLLGLMKWKRWF